MLFFVVERFRDPAAVRERFARDGRLMPEGVTYHGSWIDPATARCFQVMEAPERALIDAWIGNWSDLVDFEVTPVVRPDDYWARIGAG